MELRQLEYFIAVCETKNFTKAAKKLYTSQPAVTAAINNLEKELGVTLLIRNKRFVELSSEGTTFYKHVLTVMNSLDIPLPK